MLLELKWSAAGAGTHRGRPIDGTVQMGYVDLLLFRTPGKRVAVFAERAAAGLKDSMRYHEVLESAARTVPLENLLGGPRSRASAREAFTTAARRFDSAIDGATAWATPYVNPTTTFSAVIDQASTAGRAASVAADVRGGLPRRALEDADAAARAARTAADIMYPVQSSTDRTVLQRAANEALMPLRRGRTDMDSARSQVHEVLQPYHQYDEARLNTEAGLEYAGERIAVAGKVSAVSAETQAAADMAVAKVDTAQAAMRSFAPRQSLSSVRTLTADAAVAVRDVADRGRREPMPPGFMLKVAGAYGVTLAAAGGAGYGIYRLVKSSNDDG